MATLEASKKRSLKNCNCSDAVEVGAFVKKRMN